MVIAPVSDEKPPLECSPPLFSGCINLAWDRSDPTHSYRTEVRIHGGDWQPPPQAVGKDDTAFTSGKLGRITHIRLLFPKWDEDWVGEQIAREANAYAAASLANGKHERLARGTIQILADLQGLGSFSYVLYFVDGRVAQISASAPYEFIWNTQHVGNGPHLIDIRVVGVDGSILRTASLRYRVANR